ncbi:1-propanol dehydrogenase PduQ [Companilactobacillus ginsenosidimutans]|uniref:Alcohol dehydrogenase n=1 Tax=Companilactobacillus ginsenosidimutans TaxID=1007676 RepID=A0A0H4QXI2_9LACO|nr:1-propanol dehydrogenase PduQ [Companilactobacillus ginsenosidimutans]AKP66195.1 alcohol dehydrogenase [Companilactobacillus ginsenosidimutans]
MVVDFSLKPHVISGKDSLDTLDAIKDQTILMVCDPFLDGSDELNKIRSHVHANNHVEVFSDVKPNPPLTNIIAGVRVFDKVKPTVIIAVGGGSAIDTAKAIRFFGEKVANSKVGCFIGIPTTSGTGSEVTNTAVITDEKNNVKFPIMDDYLIPDISLLYPELVMSAPASVAAYSGLDVLTHSLESLVAKDSDLFTDAFAEKAMSVIFDDLVEVVMKQPKNYELRKTVHEASTAAGMAFNAAGLGIAHSIAHQLGATFHVPHGLACAMTLPYVVEYNAANSDLALHKYAAAARKCGLVSNGVGDKVAVRKIERTIHQMMMEMNCPKSLRAFGVDHNEAVKETDRIIKYAKKDGTFPGNPVVPSDDDLRAIYEKVIG